MRYYLIIVLLFFINRSFSQDLIVRSNGDSLQCVISKVIDSTVYFEIDQDRGVVNTSLPKSKILKYDIGYYTRKVTRMERDEPPAFIISVRNGFILNNRGNSIYIFNAQLAYYYSESNGIGLQYFHCNPMKTYRTGIEYDRYNFLGLYFSSRISNKRNTNAIIFDVGAGYIFRYSMPGISLGIGGNFAISQYFGFNINAVFLGAVIDQSHVYPNYGLTAGFQFTLPE